MFGRSLSTLKSFSSDLLLPDNHVWNICYYYIVITSEEVIHKSAVCDKINPRGIHEVYRMNICKTTACVYWPGSGRLLWIYWVWNLILKEPYCHNTEKNHYHRILMERANIVRENRHPPDSQMISGLYPRKD